MTHYFPLGIAKDHAFCNRIEERKQLKHNISRGIHTLIMAPRRFGKTSLALKAINETKLQHTVMEFTLASDHYSAENIIRIGIGKLMMGLMPTHKKVLALAAKYFSHFKPSLVIDTYLGARVELKSEIKSPHLSIGELLINIDRSAKEANKRIILFMDEFQQIVTFTEHEILEAAIRNAAQQMENTTIIFSGSHRHLLQLMFDNSSRPLYHMCDRIMLDRIHEEDYFKFIQEASFKQWKDNLSEETIQSIFKFTKRHPYYVNVLCNRLWRSHAQPTNSIIQIEWKKYIEDEVFRIANEVSKLSNHQKQMLIILAKHPFKQPTSKEVIFQMRASTASAAKCCKLLLENDYIYQNKEGYFQILDPAIEFYIKEKSALLDMHEKIDG
jgi:AAA+ ATPase superfamily predicted ATPase